MDLFYNSDVKSILHNKFVVIIGDSIQRGIYKDLILLLRENRYLKEKELRDKGEFSFHHDELIEGGRKGEMTNGINYTEVRQYVTDQNLIRFYFVTRCYNAYVESIMSDLKQEPVPDIIIMNSCLWDITRYGKESIVDYKKNLVTLFERFKEVLPDDCLVLWNTTLPISNKARGGFLIPQIEFRTTTLRLDILEANYYARSVIVERGFDILDLHFYLRHHLDKRVRDGIHWDMLAHRYITNLILSHVCKAFKIPIPNRRHAPFSSYLHENHYKDNYIPPENDFDHPECDVNLIQVHRGHQGHTGHENNGRALLSPNPSRNPFRHIYSAWQHCNTTFNSIVSGLISDRYGCHQNNPDGWRHSSWNSNQNQIHDQDPYRRSGPLWADNYNNDFAQNAVFSGAVFPEGDQHIGSFGNGSNSYFSQDSFQPYQQHSYQGPSQPRRRRRDKPYRRDYQY